MVERLNDTKLCPKYCETLDVSNVDNECALGLEETLSKLESDIASDLTHTPS